MDSLAACYSSDGEPSSSAAFSGFPLEISDNFDIDEMQLLELYKRIPPPHLRSYALSHTTNKVVVEIAQRVKDDGHFDTFRKTWMKDLETKPQYQNLVRRVEMQCDDYLKGLKWTPDMDKTAARENLRKKISSAPSVDTGIQGLLQEIHTGRYSNPIPIQHFSEAVTSIVGETVQKYIQLGTPDFPRFGKSAENTQYDDYDSMDDGSQPRSSTPPQAPPRIETASRNMFRQSPDLVEMEISSPETESTMESGEIRSSTAASADSTFVERPESRARSTGPTSDLPRNNDDIQGALDLLMFSNNGQWASDFDSDSQTEGSQAEENVEVSPARPTLISPTPGASSSSSVATTPLPFSIINVPPPPPPPPTQQLPPLMPFPPPPLDSSRFKRRASKESSPKPSSPLPLTGDSSPATLIKHIVAMTNSNPSISQPILSDGATKEDVDETSTAFWRNKWKKAKQSKEKPTDEVLPPPKSKSPEKEKEKVMETPTVTFASSELELPSTSSAEVVEKAVPETVSILTEEIKAEPALPNGMLVKASPGPISQLISRITVIPSWSAGYRRPENTNVSEGEKSAVEKGGKAGGKTEKADKLKTDKDVTDSMPATSSSIQDVRPILLKVRRIERRKSVGTKRVVLVSVPKDKQAKKTPTNDTAESAPLTSSPEVVSVQSIPTLTEASQVVMVDSASSRPARNRKSNSRYTEDFVTTPKTLAKVVSTVKMPAKRKSSKSEQGQVAPPVESASTGQVEESPSISSVPLVRPTSAPIPLVIRSESPKPILLTVKKSTSSSSKKKKTQ